jgi:hypothetical protein
VCKEVQQLYFFGAVKRSQRVLHDEVLLLLVTGLFGMVVAPLLVCGMR